MEPTGKIKLAVSFGNTKNARMEFITFDVVKIQSPYNVIMGRSTLNTFEAILHSAYLCLKIPAHFGVITMKGN